MSAAFKSRLKKLEAGHHEEELCLLAPNYWDMNDAEFLDGLRDAVRRVASNPRGIMVIRPSARIPDPVAYLLGEEEASRLPGCRAVTITRSYGCPV